MYELIYLSTANPEINQSDIENILSTARKFNADNNLSGCLIFHNNHFLQLLEGDKEIVTSLYEKIIKDQRHTNIRLLHESNKTIRSFAEWRMAFVDLSTHTDIEQKMFVDNLLTYADLTPKTNKSIDIFWKEVKNLLTN